MSKQKRAARPRRTTVMKFVAPSAIALAIAAPIIGSAGAASASVATQPGAYGATVIINRTQTAVLANGTLPTAGGGTVSYIGVPAEQYFDYTGRSDIFYRGTDNHLHSLDPNLQQQDLGGSITSSPTTALTLDGTNAQYARPSTSAQFARGTDGALWEHRGNAWQSLGGQFDGNPVAVRLQGNQQIDVFVENSSFQLWDAHSVNDGASFQWHLIGHLSASPDATGFAVTMSGGHYVFAQFTYGTGHHTYRFWSIADPTTGATDASDFNNFGVYADSVPWTTQAPVLDDRGATALIGGRIESGSSVNFSGFY